MAWIRSWLAVAMAFAAVTPDAAAQVTGGITVSTFDWQTGRSEQALAGVLQLAPAPWFLIGAVPTVLRVQSAPQAEGRTGLGDLPVYAALVHAGRSRARPTVALTGAASLPTGDARRELGRGVSVISGELAVAIDPAPGLTMRGGGARVLRVGGESPDGMATSSVFADVVMGSRSATSLSIGGYGELRGEAPDGYELARGLTASLARRLRSGPTVMVSAGRAIAGVGPDWSFSIGLGTAFGGVAPVGATAPASRTTVGLPRHDSTGLPPLCAITGC